MVPGRYTALSNVKTMVTILHGELERKAEKLKRGLIDREGGLLTSLL